MPTPTRKHVITGKQRRKENRRGTGHQASPGIISGIRIARPNQPDLDKGSLIFRDIDIGRRKWRRQRVWPEGTEKRTYDPTKVVLVGHQKTDLGNIKVGDRFTTTRRAQQRERIDEVHPTERRQTERRTDKKTRKAMDNFLKEEKKDKENYRERRKRLGRRMKRLRGE